MLGCHAALLSLRTPAAAFYLHANGAATLGMRTPEGWVIASDIDLATYLLEHGGVAVVPGTAFGLAPCIRLAYALSDADLNAACEQIVAACKRLIAA